MIHVADAKYLNGFKLELLFVINDYQKNSKQKVQKVADLEQYLKDKKEDSIFAPLKNLFFFQNFTIGANTVEWANGADIAPERLYELANQIKYEKMMDIVDDYYLSKEISERLKDNTKPIRVELDELLS